MDEIELIKITFDKKTEVFSTRIDKMHIESLSDNMLEHLTVKIGAFIQSQFDTIQGERTSKQFLQRMKD